jgi:hypothetical protein
MIPSQRLTLDLPLPPSFNDMIEKAKRRTRRSRTGGWMKRSLPVVYDQHLEAYEDKAIVLLRQQGVQAPNEPWAMWSLSAASFRLHNLRDWVELLASLKWPVDVLVRRGFVLDDSPREMAPPCIPTQTIDRRNLGVTLTIERLA